MGADGKSLDEPDLAEIPVCVLVGGVGSRLRAAVPELPKALAPVRKRPFLAYVLTSIERAGFRRVVLCTGYRGQLIRQAFGDRFGALSLEYSQEAMPLGTGGALRQACTLVADRPWIVAMNGDSLFGVDFKAFVRFHLQSASEATMAVATVGDVSQFGAVQLGSEGRVEHFVEKGRLVGPGTINAGIYALRTRAVTEIPAGTMVSLEQSFFPCLADGRLLGFPADSPFLDIGTPDSYAEANSFVDRLTDSLDEVSWKGATVHESHVLYDDDLRATSIQAGVSVVVRDGNGGVLLGRRSDCGRWGLPGGPIAAGESAGRAAVRLVREATGFDIRIRRLLFIDSEPRDRVVCYLESAAIVQLLEVVIEAEVTGGELLQSEWSQELGFFSLGRLPPDMIPPARGVLDDLQKGRTDNLR